MRIDDTPPRRSRIEPLLPMIDVVFFLVVFFMISSRLAAPEPFAVARPLSGDQPTALGEFNLFIDASGQPGFVGPKGVVLGDAALPALITARDAFCATADCPALPPILLLHADSAAPAAAVSALLPALAQARFDAVKLLTVRQ